jgi:hypothetical protein
MIQRRSSGLRTRPKPSSQSAGGNRPAVRSRFQMNRTSSLRAPLALGSSLLSR